MEKIDYQYLRFMKRKVYEKGQSDTNKFMNLYFRIQKVLHYL